MREFFHGWRRKAGVVTLVMACCLMGMWVRSRRIGESVDFILAGEHHFLLSSNGQIAWEAYPSYPNARIPWFWCYNRFPKNRKPHFSIEQMEILKLDKSFIAPGDWVLDYRSAPYCLTLLSALLLLSKPKPKEQMNASGWSENDAFALPDRYRYFGLEAINDAVAIAHIKNLWQRVLRRPNFEICLLTHLFEPATFCANTHGVPDVRRQLIAIVEAEWQQTGRNYPRASPSDKALMLLGLGLYDDLNLTKPIPELQADPESAQYYFGRKWQGVSAFLGDLISFRYLDYIVAE